MGSSTELDNLNVMRFSVVDTLDISSCILVDVQKNWICRSCRGSTDKLIYGDVPILTSAVTATAGVITIAAFNFSSVSIFSCFQRLPRYHLGSSPTSDVVWSCSKR